MCDDEKLMEVLPILRREYDNAVSKHPMFACSFMQAISLITEELGELAKELNDGYTGKAVPGWEDQALVEAAHVAVTAIRTMQMIKVCKK